MVSDKTKAPAPMFYFVKSVLHSYDYNLLVQDLLSTNVYVITLSQWESFRLQHVQLVNTTSSFEI